MASSQASRLAPAAGSRRLAVLGTTPSEITLPGTSPLETVLLATTLPRERILRAALPGARRGFI
jgi:hypothetical protein